MNEPQSVKEYILALKASKRLGGQVVFHKTFPETAAEWAEPEKEWPPAIPDVINRADIHRLFKHQALAIDKIRSGRHVVVATPTASGKTLVYNLTVLERFLKNPLAKAFYIFPLKALAQDQLLNFNKMTAAWEGRKPTAAIYDGDTPNGHRKRIRERLPNILLTNPEMLHLAFLPYHQNWASFFANLETVVVDEVHTYRGIMGSHMAQVFRRLRRICGMYHTNPTFIFNSATVANPAGLAKQLTGLEVDTVLENGSPKGKRHLLFIDPLDGPAQTAILLLKAALQRNLRTIVYTQSRKLTELIAIWAGNQAGEFADRISAYRAGFLPEERRDIEDRLTKGDLLAVISTSALELGIDIGDLDLCLLVGYPGTIVSTWQREGRVGRSGQESAMVLIAGEDALDQYFMRNPEDFLSRDPEAAVVNPYNTQILSKHALCAAAEMPLKANETYLADETVIKAVAALEGKGELLKNEAGDTWFSSRKAPHRHINLRGAGKRFRIVSSSDDDYKGEIDGFRVFKETHPGAIYLHRGETYLVDVLDLETNTVKVTAADVDYYTRARSNKETDILEIWDEKTVWGIRVFSGKIRVTEQVTGFERWRIRIKKRINRVSLDLPPQTFETESIWFEIPAKVQMDTEARYLHFMGGIHAVEHAAIGMFPLIVMTDRNDLGGISIPFHPQLGSAAVFIYDGIPGGAGLSRQAFKRAKDFLKVTLKAIQSCPCSEGCPSCVHSPKCGSGNRPIDKTAAIYILQQIIGSPRLQAIQFVGRKTKPGISQKPESEPSAVKKRTQRSPARKQNKEGLNGEPGMKSETKVKRYGVFDLETQLSAQEVGGWHRADRMKISCVVLYDSAKDTYSEYLEKDISQFIEHLGQYDWVVGFNIKRFDYQVLRGYTQFDFGRLPTLDILEQIHGHLGYRLSLDHLANVTLGKQKTADGLQALKWWKEGKLREIIDYCKHDVRITWELFQFGREKGYLLFKNKAAKIVRIPVNW